MIWQRAIAGLGDICESDRTSSSTIAQAIALHLNPLESDRTSSTAIPQAIAHQFFSS